VNRSCFAIGLVFAAGCGAAYAGARSPEVSVATRRPPLPVVPLAVHPKDSSGFIWGMVLDDSLGLALRQARVVAVGTRIGTWTDSLGRFRLTLGPGSHTLRFLRIGYVARIESVSVSPRVGQNLTIRLRRAQLKLGDVCACDGGS
jgi:carboxypeptidase-like protein